MAAFDVALCWTSVHGGSYHTLFALRDRLRREGLSCAVLLNASPPLGLQLDLDLPPGALDELTADEVLVLPAAELPAALARTRARLCVFDAHEGELVPALIRQAREGWGAITAQASTLLADYSFHGADYALVEHPISLWFVADFSRDKSAARLAQAKAILFSGNIFYEPVVNTWTSGLRTRQDFAAKYGLDAARPTALWLPNRLDGLEPAYGRVVDQARAAGFNVLVKMHPWEYKQLRHGFDPYGAGRTSAEMWGASAVEERDGSWALAFCDVGVMRTSSMGLELPFWRKPGVYVPQPGLHRRWHQLLLCMTRGCSLHLDDVEKLSGALAGGPPSFPDEAYDAAKRHTMPRGTGARGQEDSFDLHARHILDILAGRVARMRLDGPADLRRLYEPEIPREFYRHLKWKQRVRFGLRRLVGAMPRQV